MSKLFVGNLPYSATEAELSEAFAQAGQVVSVKIITDRMSGRSKGFGFVEMASPEAATAAIQRLNGADYAGRAITVSEARPQTEGGGGGGGRGPRGGGFRGDRGGRGGGGGGGYRGGGRGGDRAPRDG